MALGTALGVVLVILRLAPTAAVRGAARLVIEFFRNVPILIQLFFYYYGLPRLGLSLSAFTCATVGLSIYSGVYIAEALRAGVLAVGRGQFEAALSCGLTRRAALRYVVLPQAARLVIPPLTNLFVFTIKTSALASAVTVEELMHVTETLESETFRTFELFTAAAMLYLVLTIPLGGVARRLERRLAIQR
jgi:putative glutamine transport system permease protein